MLWKDTTHGPDAVWSRICLICLVRVSALRQVPLSQREKLVACLIFACIAKPASTGMELFFSGILTAYLAESVGAADIGCLTMTSIKTCHDLPKNTFTSRERLLCDMMRSEEGTDPYAIRLQGQGFWSITLSACGFHLMSTFSQIDQGIK